jgi:hypothetical protein
MFGLGSSPAPSAALAGILALDIDLPAAMDGDTV